MQATIEFFFLPSTVFLCLSRWFAAHCSSILFFLSPRVKEAWPHKHPSSTAFTKHISLKWMRVTNVALFFLSRFWTPAYPIFNRTTMGSIWGLNQTDHGWLMAISTIERPSFYPANERLIVVIDWAMHYKYDDQIPRKDHHDPLSSLAFSSGQRKIFTRKGMAKNRVTWVLRVEKNQCQFFLYQCNNVREPASCNSPTAKRTTDRQADRQTGGQIGWSRAGHKEKWKGREEGKRKAWYSGKKKEDEAGLLNIATHTYMHILSTHNTANQPTSHTPTVARE